MIRPLLADKLVGEHLPALTLHKLLQGGFIVGEGRRFDGADIVQQAAMDKSRRCFHAGVEIHSGNDRLHSVGKDRRALPPAVVLLTLAETEIVAQMQLQRHTMERLLADELRAELVCEQSLHRVALELHLGDYLRLGKGEEHNGGRERASILSDAVEAVIAAMYLDAGMETAAGFIHRCLLDDVRTIETPSFTDYKTALQELVQRQSGQVLSYELVGEEGPDHAKTFRMQVCLNGEPVGLGTGRTKKEAEQTAAASALEALRK